MRKIRYSTKYKKEIKRYGHNEPFLRALFKVVSMLEREEPIPPSLHPHRLHGAYEGCMECHILSDFLLIWYDEKTGDIWLQRVGTHHELFGI